MIRINRVKLKVHFVLFLAFLSVLSCKKDGGIIEEQLVITKVSKSIPTTFDIVEFDVVDENHIFAAAKSGYQIKLFKTENAGTNWEELNTPAVTNVSIIQSLVFFDENNGVIVLDKRAYRTNDGGYNWDLDYIKILPPPGASYAYQFIFAGKNDNNELLLVESTGSSWAPNRMFTSAPSSNTYTMINSVNHDGAEHDYGHYANGKFIYLCMIFQHQQSKHFKWAALVLWMLCSWETEY
jgi:hypothetical protein